MKERDILGGQNTFWPGDPSYIFSGGSGPHSPHDLRPCDHPSQSDIQPP